ncbi:hypothetical protein HJC10_25170 [Corallococcus exiguus]|uniref:hypothetical protein n=1 Tax=Corallococcus exiguus TaxID=83462 RepID=UPI000EA3B68A|nr:hypothetical protein [Corallococcus exiguus]NNC06136.1 hypothetical protein [Corallococcus exiguus]NRD43640.1 hypothetical protein [Corallococcus exiguus]RKI51087.1 hypothetical protein D7Y27_00020 [Corallococcus sp. AB004]
MRSRVLFPLFLTGLLLACASGGARSTSSEAASSDSEPVQPCAVNPTPDGGTPVFITANSDGKVHFSSTTVKVLAGQTVSFVSQVQQDRCIGVSDGGLLVDDSLIPLPVPACQVAYWTLRSGDEPGTKTSLWSCPTSDCSKCTQPTESEGIRQTINGTLEVTGRGQD